MTESTLVVVWEWIKGSEEGNAKRHKETLGVTEMFIIVIAVVVSQVCKYVKTYQIMHLKCVQFTVCQLNLNKVLKNKK